MNISIPQIRAARALLNWTQTDLAHKTGLSLTAINNLEREEVIPRGQTINFIYQAFAKHGVEFTDGNGVKLHDDPFEFRKVTGQKFAQTITDDVIRNLLPPHEIICVGKNEDEVYGLIENYDSQYQTHLKKYKIKERILVPIETKIFVSDVRHYRLLSKEAIGNIYWTVYIDRFVLMNFKKKEALWIRNKSIADTYRAQFNFLWKQSAPVDSETIRAALLDRKEKGLPI